ncbi:Uncharacterized protein HZ326_12478 [Fusarium oxysporum f. sp. albedinis]|nr:Uncharacterized protein HZ326_12478 [Fusarium oxysporum f. sp. albedinis]
MRDQSVGYTCSLSANLGFRVLFLLVIWKTIDLRSIFCIPTTRVHASTKPVFGRLRELQNQVVRQGLPRFLDPFNQQFPVSLAFA